MAHLATKIMLAASLVAMAAACKKKPPEDTPPPPATNTGEVGEDTTGIDGVAVPGSQEDFVAKVSSDRVFFETDEHDVDSEDRATLESQAAWLRQYPNTRVTIEGHADERGTRDYNLALGERRANSAKNYLAGLGIDSSRISTISYGKEQPEALGSDESSYARNRRAVTVTVR